ncbi:hypothetical protein FOZ63_017395, partial [Perkinsus olseni]
VPVYGRTMHDLNGTTTYTPYGREGECNFSVDRSKLNEFWIVRWPALIDITCMIRQDEVEKAGASIYFDRALSLEHTSLEDRRLCFIDSAGEEHFVDLPSGRHSRPHSVARF